MTLQQKLKKIFVYFTAGIVLVFLSQSPLFAFPEVIDRIAAVVAGEVITLSDVRINRAFNVHDVQSVSPVSEDLFILNKLIEQKLIIQMIESDVIIPEKDLETEVRKATEKLGAARTRRLFNMFGIGWDEIKEYFREKLLFRRIIFQKFSRSAFVSLKEIEAYYDLTYVPSQKEKGLAPRSMLEIVGDIEAELKQEKIERQVKEWLDILKKEADIQIMI
jgi:parvulin-like peptidyl-prolyl isomerase